MTPAELRTTIDHYYEQLYRVQLELNTAARRRAQYLYMSGALAGLLLFGGFAAIAALITHAFAFKVGSDPISSAYGCAIAGALGATASVSWRASLGSLQLDPAAGISALPRLGALRPSLGAIFGLAIFFALRSGVIDVGQGDKGFYFFGFFSFVAGFSERVLPDLIQRAEHQLGTVGTSDPLSPPRPPSYDDGAPDP